MNNSNRTHWFKQLFLGLMGSVALTKAVDCFYEEITKKQQCLSATQILHKFLDGSFPYAFTVVTILLLSYFFLNVIRYYMAIYIYEMETADVLRSKEKKINKARETLSGHQAVFDILKVEWGKPKTTPKRAEFRLSVVDIFLSLFIFFLIGLAARGLVNIYEVAFISVVILALDIVLVVIKRISHIPRIKRIESEFSEGVKLGLQSIQENDKNTGSALYTSVPYDKIQTLEKQNTNEPRSEKTLKSWIWIDLGEMGCWVTIMYLCHQYCTNYFCLEQRHQQYTWLFLAPLFGLFVCLFLDLWLNRESWASIIGIKTNE